MWGGGVLSRVAGLNAQANSACRSSLGSGAPGSFLLRAMVTVTRASATDRRETGARLRPLGLGVGAGVGVPADHLVFGDLGLGQAGAGVEGPPVADRVLQPGQEPVGKRAGLERPAVLTPVDRPPDPVARCAAAADLLDVPEPDVVAVHLLSAPTSVACPVLPGGAATRSARCAGPAPRRPAAAPPAARLPAGASGRKPPGTPAARRSPHRSSAAGHPRYRALRPGWRRAGRERLAFAAAARPWVRDDGRSAPPAASSPAPARPATADGSPELRGNGKGRRAAPAGARGLAGALILPEGKAGRTRRGIPDGGRRHTPAGRWPADRAGLPPGTAGINPHLSPPGQVRPAPGRDGLDTRPRATGRYGPVPIP